jgi:hypothetical protein
VLFLHSAADQPDAVAQGSAISGAQARLLFGKFDSLAVHEPAGILQRQASDLWSVLR